MLGVASTLELDFRSHFLFFSNLNLENPAVSLDSLDSLLMPKS